METLVNSISTASRNNYKRTEEYRQKVETIKNQTGIKYQDLIANEKSLLRKLILRIQKRSEIKKAIDDLTSLDKMYSMK